MTHPRCERFVETKHSRLNRFTTQRHCELQSHFCRGADQSLPSSFLCHLLTELRTNTLTECWSVGVRAAGIGADGSSWIRYTFRDSEFDISFQIDASVLRKNADVLEQFASEFAAFTIGEPGLSLKDAELVDGAYRLRISS